MHLYSSAMFTPTSKDGPEKEHQQVQGNQRNHLRSLNNSRVCILECEYELDFTLS